MYIVTLDAGHQKGIDSGAQGFGLHEEDITLDIAKRMKLLLEKNNIKVIMTREGDYIQGGNTLTNSLQSRVNISDNANSDIFISLHTNAFNGKAYGSEVHIVGIGGRAEKLSKFLIPQLAKTFYNRGLKISPSLYVLKNTNCPAVLCEIGFIDNQNDNTKLANINIRQEIATNLVQGICSYFNIQFKQSTFITSQAKGDENMEFAILSYGLEDLGATILLAKKYDNCAIYFRNSDKTFNQDCLKAKTLFVVGGSSVGHKNEKLLSGETAKDTLQKVINIL